MRTMGSQHHLGQQAGMGGHPRGGAGREADMGRALALPGPGTTPGERGRDPRRSPGSTIPTTANPQKPQATAGAWAREGKPSEGPRG